jgi:esterase/lipase superfamily enzyme
MSTVQQIPCLEYLKAYPIESTGRVARRHRNIPFEIGNLSVFGNPFDSEVFRSDTFNWRLAQKLEGVEIPFDEGVWPIQYWRCQRRFGMPGSKLFPSGAALESLAPTVYSAAKEMRIFLYHRATTAAEAVELIRNGKEVRYATKMTHEWYDPQDGHIAVPDADAEICGSHSVPLLALTDESPQKFVFINSWGEEWGSRGCGAISFDHFERFMIEAWHGFGNGLFPPMHFQSGLICLEWKWNLPGTTIDIHGREIVDADSGDRVAWAFCSKRDGFLDIEEFFVWPSERKKGYARVLARMVKDLAKSMNLPLRMLVSFADSIDPNWPNVEHAAKLLDLHLSESPNSWVHWVATSVANKHIYQRVRPKRPAFMLERLRPIDEAPVPVSTDYRVVFGTNRRLQESTSGEYEFVGERGTELHTGVATITVPTSHRFGAFGRSWLGVWTRLFGKRSELSKLRIFKSESAFSDEIGYLLSGFHQAPHNLLYVHGFNVSFDGALRQAAHFGVDLKVPGASFVFSWPSAGSMTQYAVDEATIETCLPYFKDFVDRLLKNSDDVPLNIIAHSMGSRLVTSYLEQAARQQCPIAEGRIRNVVFAAPDIDAELFRQKLQIIGPFVSCITLYSTNADVALRASNWLHGYDRAGLAPPILTQYGLNTIHVENFNLFELGHGYFANASNVLHDLYILLKFGTVPSERPALVQAQTISGDLFWKLSLR